MDSRRTIGTERRLPSRIDPDVAATVLPSPERRAILRRLRHRECAVSLADLACDVAAETGDAGGGRPTGGDRPTGGGDDEPAWERVRDLRSSLHHVHLPKLVDSGLVERNPQRNTVRLLDDGRELAAMLAGDS